MCVLPFVDSVHNTSHFPPFFFNDTAPTEIYTLSLHDALPIYIFLSLRACFKIVAADVRRRTFGPVCSGNPPPHVGFPERSEEHTSELQSHSDLVCRLLLEKKKKKKHRHKTSVKTQTIQQQTQT